MSRGDIPAPRRQTRLATKFLLASALLVAATVACGGWSMYTLVQLSVSVGETLRESQQTLDLTATLASHLEREDDALLLVLSGAGDGAGRDLLVQRANFDAASARLWTLLSEEGERAVARALREHVEAYRTAGDALVQSSAAKSALEQYHERVNPILRRAVLDCGTIREHNFRSMQLAGVRARDHAGRASRVVAAMLVAALIVSVVVALYLARSVVRPVLVLTTSVDAVRRGEFNRRVRVRTQDELGRLAEGFNQMADALEDFRRSNLGEVLRAKSTLEATLEALPDAIVVVGPDGRVESMNRPARRVLLAAGAETVPLRFEDVAFPPSAREAIKEALARVSTDVGSRATDLGRAFAIDLGGSERKLLPIAVPVPNFTPGVHGAIAVLYDVTDFVRLDELRGEVVAVASHELKTPLTTIRMNLMLLAEHLETLTAQQREIISTALLGCEELETIIQRLLDVASIEAGQLRLAREQVDLLSLLTETAARFRDRAEEVGVGLRLPEPRPAVMVSVDAARLSIVVSNLVTNALKYTRRGGAISVAVSSMQDAGPGDGWPLQIAVTDTGPGIPVELRERVFEKFFRVEHARPNWSRGVRGAGLGLYLCRQIVEAHGGRIRATGGEGGVGLKVIISLPAGIEASGPSGGPLTRRGAGRSSASRS